MKYWAGKSWFVLIVILMASQSYIAQANVEVVTPPIYLYPSNDLENNLADTPEPVQTEVKTEPIDENPYLADDVSGFLPLISEMLNQGAEERAQRSFEGLRRKAMLRPTESLVSQFLEYQPAKKSA